MTKGKIYNIYMQTVKSLESHTQKRTSFKTTCSKKLYKSKNLYGLSPVILELYSGSYSSVFLF